MASDARPVIRIVLVDDQPLLRLGFRLVLDAEPGFEVVGEAEDGASGIAVAAELLPDIILMDVRMPGMNGIEATKVLVRDVPSSRILILTTFDLDEYAFSALRAGASGFLLKDARPAELVAAIRAVAAGDAVVSPRVTKQLLDLFGSKLPVADSDAGSPAEMPKGREPTAVLRGSTAGTTVSSGVGAGDERPVTAVADELRLGTLTDREREVLLAIAGGLTNIEIAARLTVSESTVKSHVGRVLAKLEARDRVQAVILAYEFGLTSDSSAPHNP
ncbi:response regulator transcription factor [Subtercola sp. PAMC28395]|nr:response regulator transcription factor [Subtercola sp. PAMC28395]